MMLLAVYTLSGCFYPVPTSPDANGEATCEVVPADAYCDEILACCDTVDCWYSYNGFDYYCYSPYDCYTAADAVVEDACDFY